MPYRIDLLVYNETLDFQHCRYYGRHQSLYRENVHVLGLFYIYRKWYTDKLSLLFICFSLSCSINIIKDIQLSMKK